MFGGILNGVYQDSTWVYRNQSWTQLAFTSTPPGPRAYASMAWDGRDGYMIMFGGIYENQPLHDTWEFINGTWTPLSPSSNPGSLWGASMIYDGSLHSVVLFGGYYIGFWGETLTSNSAGGYWSFWGGQWTHNSTQQVPPASAFAQFVWDGHAQEGILFGGRSSASGPILSDEWQLVGNQWRPLDISGPAGRAYAIFTWDPVGNFALLSGGLNSSGLILSDSWLEQNFGQWANVTGTAGGPPPFDFYDASTFDAVDGYILVYDGWGSISGSTWAFGATSPLAASLSISPSIVVVGGLINITTNVSGGWGPFSFNYSGFPTGCNSVSANNFSCDPTMAGSFSISVLVNDSLGQTAIAMANLTVAANQMQTLASVSIEPPEIYLAPGESEVLSAYSNGSEGGNLTMNTSFSWSISSSAGTLNSTTDESVNFTAGSTSESFSITVIGYYRNNSTSVSISGTINTGPGLLTILSGYGGVFLTNRTVYNSFGVYSTDCSDVQSVSGMLGGETYPLVDEPSIGLWVLPSVPMSNLTPGAQFSASGICESGAQLAGILTLPVVWSPSWLDYMFTPVLVGVPPIEAPSIGLWNQSYSISGDLHNIFAGIYTAAAFDPALKNLTSDFLPSPDLGVIFVSQPGINKSTLTLSGQISFSPSVQFNAGSFAGSIEVLASLSVQSHLSFGQSRVEWQYAWVNLTVNSSASLTIPIAGGTFEVDGHSIGFGISFTITVSPSFLIQFLLAPTTNQSLEFVSGLALAIQKVSGDVSATVEGQVNIDLWLASFTAGASVQWTDYFESSPDSNHLQVQRQVFNWSDFAILRILIWSWTWGSSGSNSSYPTDSTGNATGGAPSDKTFILASQGPINLTYSVLPRYSYDGVGYDTEVAQAGATNGTAIHDLFPRTNIASAGDDFNASIVYTTDNISKTQGSGFELQGWRFASQGKTFTPIPSPSSPGEIQFNPQLATMANGSEVGVWETLPSNGGSPTSPNSLSNASLSSGLFNPTTNSWGSYRTLESGLGYVEALKVGACGTQADLLALFSPSLLPGSSEQLVEFDILTGATLSDNPVQGVTAITDFDCSTNLAILQVGSGTEEVLNIATEISLPNISATLGNNVSILSYSFVEGAPEDLAVLYDQNGIEKAVVYDYNSPTSPPVGPISATQGTTIDAVAQNGTYYIAIGSQGGVDVWEVPTVGPPILVESASAHALTSFGLTPLRSGIFVWWLDNYNSSSSPLLNLNFAFIPVTLTGIPSPPGPGIPVSTPGPLSLSPYVELIVVIGAMIAVAVVILYSTRRQSGGRPVNPNSKSNVTGKHAAGRTIPQPADTASAQAILPTVTNDSDPSENL
jgi:hypothetical protein